MAIDSNKFQFPHVIVSIEFSKKKHRHITQFPTYHHPVVRGVPDVLANVEVEQQVEAEQPLGDARQPGYVELRGTRVLHGQLFRQAQRVHNPEDRLESQCLDARCDNGISK